MRRSPFSILITLIFCLFHSILVSQSKWQNLRGYGTNSYTTRAIHSLAEDYTYRIVYASIGSEVYQWKGGNSSWTPIGGSSPLNADGIISTLTTDKLHNVYAAGHFANENGRWYVAQSPWNAHLF